MEDLHWDLSVAMVFFPEFRVVDSDVVFEVFTRHKNFDVFAATVDARYGPISDSDRDTCDDEYEEICLETTTVYKGKDAFDNPWYDEDQSSELNI
jgi:hypothetical protein